MNSEVDKMGYSNNRDYFGDWYGNGQIDYSKVINPEESGDLYLVKMYCGAGTALDVYVVKAYGDQDAIDKVFEWAWENEGHNGIVYDYDNIYNEVTNMYEEDPEYFGKDYSFEDFEDRWISEFYISNSDYNLFADRDHFFVGKVPSKYLK